MMKKIFRYRMSSWSFVLGMIISFVSLYLGVRSQMALKNAYAEKNGNTYQFETYCTYAGKQFSPDIIYNAGYGNCMIEELYVMLDDVHSINAINIIIYNNEDIHLPLKEGHWLSKNELKKEDEIAYIGIDYKDYTYEIEGEPYFKIHGESYKVVGYIGGGRSNEYDRYVMLFAGNLGEMVQTQLYSDSQYMGLSLAFKSDKKNMEEVANMSAADELFVYANNENDDVYVGVDSKATYFWLFIYGGCVLVLVSIFWIIQREHELAIRKAYGYSNKKLVLMLVRDLCILSVISISISMIIIWLFNINRQGFMNYITDEIMLFFIVVGGFLVSVITLTIIYPIICIVKKLPAIDINKKEEKQV